MKDEWRDIIGEENGRHYEICRTCLNDGVYEEFAEETGSRSRLSWDNLAQRPVTPFRQKVLNDLSKSHSSSLSPRLPL